MSDLDNNEPQQAADDFYTSRMDDDFTIRIPNAEPEQPATPQLLTKELDFGDGPIVVEAETAEELADKVITVSREYFDNLRQNQQVAQPAVESQFRRYEPVPELTIEEEAALALQLNQNPRKAVKRFIEAELGMSFDEFRDNVQKAHEVSMRVYGNDIGADFVRRHTRFDREGYIVGGDYYPCPENAELIRQYVSAMNLDRPPTPQDFDYAFNNLRLQNRLIPIPEPEENEQVPLNNTASTGLSSRMNAAPLPTTGQKGKDLYSMSDEELKAEAERQFYARQNGGRGW